MVAPTEVLASANPSGTVSKVLRELWESETVRSWDIVQRILFDHPEYAGKQGSVVGQLPGPPIGGTRSASGWLRAVAERYAGDRLHGRAMIVGLTLVDSDLEAYLSSTASTFLVTLRGEIMEPIESVFPPELAPASAPSGDGTTTGGPVLAGYVSDMARGADHLGVTAEVRTIAHVLLSKTVRPPLSLGLFGDWGSGKSFFMGRLQREIERQSARHRWASGAGDGAASDWCTRVVQIQFNAWHFSDDNLWASLVTRIYGALFEALEGKTTTADKRRALVDQKARAHGEVAQAESAAQAARAEVAAAAARVREARAESAETARTLRTMIGTVGQLLGQEPAVKARLDRAAVGLGVPEAAESYDALVGLHADLQSARSRTAAVAASAVRSPRSVAVLAALVVAMPLLAVAAVSVLDAALGAAWFGTVGRTVAALASVVASGVAWASSQLRRGMALVEQVDAAFETARTVRAARIEASPTVQHAEAAMVAAQGAEAAAVASLAAAETQLQRVERELFELRPERQLARLLGDRDADRTYSQHLGLISHIRADFERMSDLLQAWETEPVPQGDPPPIQRIILYIDDLDRCRPDQVVRVLEAIHLLLAFELFVVVVAVDPRWLRHSLAVQYRDVLTSDGDPAEPPTDDDGSVLATPQDYLEKIFQIPYALRPVGEQGYRSLVRALAPVPSDPATEPAPDATRTSAPSAHEGTGSPTSALSAPPVPRPLLFADPERADMEQLWPLFATPRTVKRFVNTYRLLRAGLGADEVAVFERGEYQTALLLLAIVTGASRDAHEILDRIRGHISLAGAHWNDVLTKAAAGPAAPSPTAEIETFPDLEQVAGLGFVRMVTLDEFDRWAPRVARFSYAVQSTSG